MYYPSLRKEGYVSEPLQLPVSFYSKLLLHLAIKFAALYLPAPPDNHCFELPLSHGLPQQSPRQSRHSLRFLRPMLAGQIVGGAAALAENGHKRIYMDVNG